LEPLAAPRRCDLAETGKSGEILNLGAGAPQSISRLVELIGGPVVPDRRSGIRHCRPIQRLNLALGSAITIPQRRVPQ